MSNNFKLCDHMFHKTLQCGQFQTTLTPEIELVQCNFSYGVSPMVSQNQLDSCILISSLLHKASKNLKTSKTRQGCYSLRIQNSTTDLNCRSTSTISIAEDLLHIWWPYFEVITSAIGNILIFLNTLILKCYKFHENKLLQLISAGYSLERFAESFYRIKIMQTLFQKPIDFVLFFSKWSLKISVK